MALVVGTALTTPHRTADEPMWVHENPRHPPQQDQLMRSGGAVLHSDPHPHGQGAPGRPLTRLMVLAMIKTRYGTLVSALDLLPHDTCDGVHGTVWRTGSSAPSRSPPGVPFG